VNRRKNKTGLKLVIDKCRRRFRIPENLYHYSEEDYREAERKYIKYNLYHGNSNRSEKSG
jgi:hypothetical protein